MLITTLLCTKGHSQLPYTNPVYDSVFIENFSTGPYMDTSKWNCYYTWGAGNFYSSDTVTGWCGIIQDQVNISVHPFETKNRIIDSGTCKLIALNDTTIGWRWKWYDYPSTECSMLGLSPEGWMPSNKCLQKDLVPYKYSSGMLLSKEKIKFGYIEMRYRIPGWTPNPHNGYSVNFWMYANDPTPHSELDIFEVDGRQGRFTNNVHVDAGWDSIKGISDDPIPVSLQQNVDLSQWHTTACNWTPDSISFYLDGVFQRRTLNQYDTNQYLLPMPIIVDLGLEATNFCTTVDSLTDFPTWEIDYIKVWQPKLACDTAKSYCNITASAFNSKIYKNLSIGGSGCTANFNNGKISALGTEYVLLQEGVEIGNNMETLIDVWTCWEGQSFEKMSEHPNPPPVNFTKLKSTPQN
ncbi:MAG TPA: family 16 glycosylhydrolase [Bacteroidia bacterium]